MVGESCSFVHKGMVLKFVVCFKSALAPAVDGVDVFVVCAPAFVESIGGIDCGGCQCFVEEHVEEEECGVLVLFFADEKNEAECCECQQ